MSYPDPRYHGDTGEVTATVRRADDPPDLVFPTGVTVHYVASGASTDGAFGLYRWEMAGDTPGAAPHFHRTISESFYVLTGTVGLYDGRAWNEAVPGDYVFVPPGGLHGFRNQSGAPASMLILFAPGAPREEYVSTLVAMAEGRVVMTQEELTDFFDRHDNHYV